jgi:HlyD family secretion protein
MRSKTYVNEVDIQNIEKGQTVEVGLDADSEKQLSGIVESVANIGEQRRGSDAKVFEVLININESDTTLRPAMTTSNSILIDKYEMFYLSH